MIAARHMERIRRAASDEDLSEAVLRALADYIIWQLDLDADGAELVNGRVSKVTAAVREVRS